MKLYGKSSGPLLSLKRPMLEDNDKLVAYEQACYKVYKEQPVRRVCKTCANSIGVATFVKTVPYAICETCGHLNGLHENTDAYNEFLYSDNDGKNYSREYLSVDIDAFNSRVENVYLPKAQFLKRALEEKGIDPAKQKYADIGAGAGYFIAALNQMGFSQIKGYEISNDLVKHGNYAIGKNLLEISSVDPALISRLDVEIVSMIGVLEHLQEPRSILKAIKSNKNIHYLLISVPLFSLCVMLEMVFSDISERQLSSGHTHLYTESSLNWICKEYGFERVAEWWFGSDMMDLHRGVSIMLGRQDQPSDTIVQEWSKRFLPVLDALQLQLDQMHLSSEVHMLLKTQ